jgi:carbon storage regulator
MLVLARKLDESIVIGDNIIVKVISVDKGVVKLGIEAPSSISIVRSELLEDIKGSNIAASKETSADALSSLAELLKK